MRAFLKKEVDVPEGATHHWGDPFDPEDVVWIKYHENSTGTFKGWCSCEAVGLEWKIIGEQRPNGIMEIPFA